VNGLLAVANALRAGPDLASTLNAVAASVAASMQVATVAINVYRPAFHDFEVVVVHGSHRARETLLGVTSPAEEWALLIDDRFQRRGAYFIPEGAFDWDAEIAISYTPDIEPSDDPQAWRAEDALFVPLRSSTGVMLGVMSVDEPHSGRRPTDEDLDVLAAVATQAGMVIESAKHAQAASRHRGDVQHLLRVSSRLTIERDRNGIARTVCEGIRDALGFERVAVMLPDAEGRFTAGATTGWPDGEPRGSWRIEHLGTLLDPQLAQDGCILVTRDVAYQHVHPELRTIYSSRRNGRGPHAWQHHWLLVPMYGKDGRLLGVIWPDDPADHLLPTEERLRTLRAFANQAASAIEAAGQREQLQHLAEHDPLTDLRNRRGLHEAIDRAITAAGEDGVALVVADADSFTRVNDELGYDCGDRVLRRIASAIRGTLNPGGIGARLGGEEFALVLPRADAVAARLAAEALRRDTAETSDVPWGLTLSAGIAVTGDGIHDAESLLRAATRALHAAKRLGRDRVVFYDPVTLEPLLEALGRSDGREAHHLSAVLLLAETLDLRDAGTARHSQTVGRYAQEIAMRLGFDPDRVERMRIAGLLHDIGKLAVADAILHKPGSLTDAEWEEVRRHSEVGARILSHAGLRDIASWVLAHHERWTGGGYPHGTAGEAIPLEARILAVADAYEAMTAVRPYRTSPLTHPAAQAELERCSGQQFDPAVVEAFLAIVREQPLPRG
jgi:diguanylate cyclase (GGDEF)-like protein/putative nucleotidyltransferase with HDIG domain